MISYIKKFGPTKFCSVQQYLEFCQTNVWQNSKVFRQHCLRHSSNRPSNQWSLTMPLAMSTKSRLEQPGATLGTAATGWATGGVQPCHQLCQQNQGKNTTGFNLRHSSNRPIIIACIQLPAINWNHNWYTHVHVSYVHFMKMWITHIQPL